MGQQVQGLVGSVGSTSVKTGLSAGSELAVALAAVEVEEP
jgi:hypothetical protein